MYDFEPTDEQQMLIDLVRRYAASDLRPAAHDAEEEAKIPPALIRKGWELGILQASVPEQYGGFGERSAVTGVLALEEMAWGDMAGALAVMAPGLFAMPVLLEGSEAQKQEYLPNIVEGDWPGYTAALLEPTFDFDPLVLKTRASQNDGQWVITGEKTYVPYADSAQAFLVYASLDGQTQAFIIPAGLDGVKVGDRMKLLGVNALPMYRVSFEGVQVPLENRLGGPEGHSMTSILDSSRVALAAVSIGLSKCAFEYARDYAKERDVFGVKVAQKQAIAFMLAEMAVEIESIRLLTWEAAWMIDQGKPEANKMAYLALTGASDMAMMVTDRAVQILGGHGYVRDHPVEHWMRNGRGVAMLSGLVLV